MGILRDLNIVIGEDGQASTIFEELFPSFLEIKYKSPSDYVKIYWNQYLKVRTTKIPNEQTRRGINGSMFEYIICTILIRENILPIFKSAKVAFVPNINYDILLYSEQNGPICLSAKTSFRERYKQADLEAMALKNVHRISKSFLITLSDSDADQVSKKIIKGDTFGLDDVIVATSEKFDQFIDELKSLSFSLSPKVSVIESNQIITEDDLKRVM
ncbi:hypothetical protein [Cecembia lonarensis]|uniref:Uncharacterized protein n=1 Tax=Cecembia lonarensis (strain CCUG 58316 / KCTC 22772 / LW9) TaxID=1225176 RepID=K1LKF8_CECL9|nr:hypothetical protein [Cecembia lonarensis]EKB50823.1 hypothetical protein B879_00568 [Cecembia lonarensis LW9]